MATFNYPDEIFSLLVTPETGSQTQLATIATAVDPLVLTQDTNAPGAQYVSTAEDLTIFGDVVIIRGPLSLPSRTVTILARQLGSEADSQNRSAGIDVSGGAGAPPNPPLAEPPTAGTGTDGTAGCDGTLNAGGPGGSGTAGANGNGGSAGGNAGSITVATESFLPSTSLALAANGGTGGAGQDGQAGGDAGNGGDGAIISCGEWQVWCTDGGPGGVGGTGGTGGTGGDGGNGGTISISYVVAPPANTLSTSVQSGSVGTPGNPGAGGSGGNGGNAGCYQANGGANMGPASGGSLGAAGTPGNPGSVTEAVIGYSALAPLANPAQRLMVLQVARILYLSSDPSASSNQFSQVATLLTWLQNVTACFNDPSGCGGNPLNLSSPDISQLAAIYQQANSLAFQLRQGLDYFGNRPSQVPLVSYDTYETVLGEMLQDLQQIETVFDAYFQALQNQQETDQQLENSIDQTNTQINTLTGQQTSLLQSATSQVGVINSDETAVANQKIVLLAAIQSFEQEIEALAGVNCIITTILDALSLAVPLSGSTDLAYARNVIAAAGSIQSEIPNLAGLGTLPTNYTVAQVDIYGQSVANLADAYTESQNVITPTDPNAYKVLALQSQLNTLVQPYLNLTSAQDAIDAMIKYVALVQQMNNDIYTYNNYIAQLSQVTAQLAQVNAQFDDVQAQLTAGSNPALPLMVAHMSRLYEDAKAICVYQVYMASRALAYWSLDNSYSVYTTLGLNDTGTVTSADISGAQTELLKSWETVMEQWGLGAQTFGGQGQTGIQLVINDLASLTALKTNNELWFALPPVLANTPSGQSPFSGLADVRLTLARAWVNGATTSSGQLTVKLTQTGIETIVTPSGTPAVFTHDPITINFIYDYATRSIVEDATIGTVGAYALVGPFTLWRLEVPAVLNTALDLGNVTDITFEFWGQNYAFTSNPQKDASLVFNGQSSGHVAIQHDQSLASGGSVAVSAWVYLLPGCPARMSIVSSNGYRLGVGPGDHSTDNTYRSLRGEFIDVDGQVFSFEGGQVEVGKWVLVTVDWKQGDSATGLVGNQRVASVPAGNKPLNLSDAGVVFGLGSDGPYYGQLSSVAIANGPGSDYLGFWPMHEGTGEVVMDLSGNSNHGTIVNDDESLRNVIWDGATATLGERLAKAEQIEDRAPTLVLSAPGSDDA